VAVTTDVDSDARPTCIPLSFEVSLSTETAFLTFSALVTTTGIRVPGGGLPTVAIVLCEVHLPTAARGARVTVATDTAIWPAGVGQVEIVVYVSVCS